MQTTSLIILSILGCIIILITPLPSWFLDIGIALSFSISILILTTVLFIDRPSDFSSFPTILLIALVLRLALNVSSTRLIIGEGHTGSHAAGKVIEGFSYFIIGGDIFIGLIIFLIFLIINFFVITKGAARMAEVGARFALDGLPGKQLAIDSDVSAGSISHDEAQERRRIDAAETTFLGSLDGVSKFVKGDAVASLLITVMNLTFGLIIGLYLHNISFSSAMNTYAILTIGDSLVSQIPALIISIASGLLLSRIGATEKINIQFQDQIGRNPHILFITSIALIVLSTFPGLPFIIFFTGGIIFLIIGLTVQYTDRYNSIDDTTVSNTDATKKRIGDSLDINAIDIRISISLVNLIEDTRGDLSKRVDSVRELILQRFGIVLPKIRIVDDSSLSDGMYAIDIQGSQATQGYLQKDHLLILIDESNINDLEDMVREPVYGTPARWVKDINLENTEEQFTITPTEVLTTHLLETIKKNLPRLLGLRDLQRLLSEFANVSCTERAQENKKLLDELIPTKVAPEKLLYVMRHLLSEGISVRNLPVILEAISSQRDANISLIDLAEHTRHHLHDEIISTLPLVNGKIPVLQLSREWENVLDKYILKDRDIIDYNNIHPKITQELKKSLILEITKKSDSEVDPVILTSTHRRLLIHSVLKTAQLSNSVISYSEVMSSDKLLPLGSIKLRHPT